MLSVISYLSVSQNVKAMEGMLACSSGSLVMTCHSQEACLQLVGPLET